MSKLLSLLLALAIALTVLTTQRVSSKQHSRTSAAKKTSTAKSSTIAVLPQQKSTSKKRTSYELQRSFLEVYDSITDELKKFGSSDFENILLKATSTKDSNRPKKKYISSLITAVKEYTGNDVHSIQTYDDQNFFALVLHKFHVKLNHMNWRRRLKAINIFHVIFRSLQPSTISSVSSSSSSSNAVSIKHTSFLLREKLRTITKTYCKRTKCNYYNYKSIKKLNSLDRDRDSERKVIINKTPYKFLNAYTKYCLFRCVNFNADFTFSYDDEDSDSIEVFLSASKKLLVYMADVCLDRDDCTELTVYCLLQVAKDADQLSKALKLICTDHNRYRGGHDRGVVSSYLEAYSGMQKTMLQWVARTNRVLSRYDYITVPEETFLLLPPNATVSLSPYSDAPVVVPVDSVSVGENVYKMF